MPRSPPPAAINSMAATMMAITESGKESDLPLRNHPSAVDNDAHIHLPPTPPDEPPSRAGTEPILSGYNYAETPSSTIVEFGDAGMHTASAARRAEQMIRDNYTYSRSRSRSGASDVPDTSRSTPRVTGRSNSPSMVHSSSRSQSSQSVRSPSASSQSSRSHSAHCGATVGRERGYSDKLEKFFQSMDQSPPLDPGVELVSENVGLHQRIAALQRTERDLLKENQELNGRIRTFGQKYEVRRQQWKEEAQKKEEAFEARVREFEARLARQEEEIAQLKLVQKEDGTFISDEDIENWFSMRSSAWQSWAEDFGHRDSSRIQSGLHPLQMLELCEGVKGFVRLTAKGDLPEDLLAGAGTTDTNAAHILLHGMLTNFIITETLESPFWIFGVLSGNAIELESPCIPQNSMSPVGFRMDLAMWNNVAPLRSARLPQPMGAILAQPPVNGKQPPRLITAVQSLSVHTSGLSNLPSQGMPARQDMESLFGLVREVQQNENGTQKCVSQLMRVLAEGGLNLALEDAKGEKRQLLVEARKNYASKLKDRFLSGPARFLLQDQDAVGIMKLERRLLDEFDMALRFSCGLWSRPHDSPVFKGLDALSSTAFHTPSSLMSLCSAQDPCNNDTPTQMNQQRDQFEGDPKSPPPPAYYDGQSVLIVLRPAVESARAITNREVADQKPNRIWTKAQVLLSTPQLKTPLTAVRESTDPILTLTSSPIPQTPTSALIPAPLKTKQTPPPSKPSPTTIHIASAMKIQAVSPPAPSSTRRQGFSSAPSPSPPQVPPKDSPTVVLSQDEESPSRLLFKVVSLATKS